MYIPTDNTCASNVTIIDNVVRAKKVPVFAGEEGICEGCGAITLSISYYNIGVKTGEMAAMILKGEKTPADLPVYSMTADQCEKFISLNNLQDAGITVSQDIIDEFTNIDK